MEKALAIVEPCPECGKKPNKVTTALDCDGSVQWFTVTWSWGFIVEGSASYFSEWIYLWNTNVFYRRLEKEGKPCPFCGSDDIAIDTQFDEWFIVCNECSGRSGSCDTKQGALEAWNRRPDSNE